MTQKIDAKMMYANSLNLANLQRVKIKKDLYEVEEEKEDLSNSSLRDIKWIGEKTIIELHANWIRTPEKLKETTEDELRKIIKSPLTLKSILDFINN